MRRRIGRNDHGASLPQAQIAPASSHHEDDPDHPNKIGQSLRCDAREDIPAQRLDARNDRSNRGQPDAGTKDDQRKCQPDERQGAAARGAEARCATRRARRRQTALTHATHQPAYRVEFPMPAVAVFCRLVPCSPTDLTRGSAATRQAREQNSRHYCNADCCDRMQANLVRGNVSETLGTLAKSLSGGIQLFVQ